MIEVRLRISTSNVKHRAAFMEYDRYNSLFFPVRSCSTGIRGCFVVIVSLGI